MGGPARRMGRRATRTSRERLLFLKRCRRGSTTPLASLAVRVPGAMPIAFWLASAARCLWHPPSPSSCSMRLGRIPRRAVARPQQHKHPRSHRTGSGASGPPPQRGAHTMSSRRGGASDVRHRLSAARSGCAAADWPKGQPTRDASTPVCWGSVSRPDGRRRPRGSREGSRCRAILHPARVCACGARVLF